MLSLISGEGIIRRIFDKGVKMSSDHLKKTSWTSSHDDVPGAGTHLWKTEKSHPADSSRKVHPQAEPP